MIRMFNFNNSNSTYILILRVMTENHHCFHFNDSRGRDLVFEYNVILSDPNPPKNYQRERFEDTRRRKGQPTLSRFFNGLIRPLTIFFINRTTKWPNLLAERKKHMCNRFIIILTKVTLARTISEPLTKNFPSWDFVFNDVPHENFFFWKTVRFPSYFPPPFGINKKYLMKTYPTFGE